MKSTSTGRREPTKQRSEATRIALLDAAVEVAAEFGVRGVTHRRVATKADLSLGLTSYHFASIDDLLLEAITRWINKMSTRWEARFLAAKSPEDMIDAVITLITALHENPRDRILLYEAYAQSVRDPAYHRVVSEWSQAARGAVERLYSTQTSQRLEAVWEGLTVQLVMGAPIDFPEQAIALIRLILDQEESPSPRGSAPEASLSS